MALRTLDDVLAHVGPLDDAPGPETGRERFRRHLADNIQNLGRLREYVDTCLGSPDEQHARALQDLINQLALALGLEVEFGPYERLPGSIGYDGRWTFASGDQIVLEVKRHETFADQRSTLARVIEQLVREKQIADFKSVVGLHVIADPHLDPGHLERSILAEQPSPLQLRTIRPESLFSLARLCVRNSLSQADLLALLRAAPPAVDPDRRDHLANGCGPVG